MVDASDLLLTGQGLEDGRQRRQVRMNIGENGGFHGSQNLVRPPVKATDMTFLIRSGMREWS